MLDVLSYIFAPFWLMHLNQQQDAATPIFDDNRGSVLMSQASQPTRQTRHIDIREFALVDWWERDLIKLELVSSIPTIY
jgi:hypothetical protein